MPQGFPFQKHCLRGAGAPPKIASLSDSCLTVDGQGFIVESSGVKTRKSLEPNELNELPMSTDSMRWP